MRFPIPNLTSPSLQVAVGNEKNLISCTYMYVYTYVCTHMYIRTYVDICVCTYVHICVCTYVHICVYTYVHMLYIYAELTIATGIHGLGLIILLLWVGMGEA